MNQFEISSQPRLNLPMPYFITQFKIILRKKNEDSFDLGRLSQMSTVQSSVLLFGFLKYTYVL